jgi:hypothetical protein
MFSNSGSISASIFIDFATSANSLRVAIDSIFDESETALLLRIDFDSFHWIPHIKI